mmetsp:Transcript_61572/g.144208  ORF Transcript_61572/g.144208 Transcript_61572/m.144208 type:complete len:242 (+) Transcript_61572:43-768(+)
MTHRKSVSSAPALLPCQGGIQTPERSRQRHLPVPRALVRPAHVWSHVKMVLQVIDHVTGSCFQRPISLRQEQGPRQTHDIRVKALCISRKPILHFGNLPIIFGRGVAAVAQLQNIEGWHTLFHSREPCLEIQSKGHGILEDRGTGQLLVDDLLVNLSVSEGPCHRLVAGARLLAQLSCQLRICPGIHKRPVTDVLRDSCCFQLLFQLLPALTALLSTSADHINTIQRIALKRQPVYLPLAT